MYLAPACSKVNQLQTLPPTVTQCKPKSLLKPGFHHTANAISHYHDTKQSDYKVEQSSFTLISLFLLEIGSCRGRNWLNGTGRLEEFTL